ncbi:AraC-type DNA-binding protein [Acetitomaculum ruminis DSM 5522]|uniref:AraC-type DNA-binding protein n=1 Tax=Acetitomaculum ruminis DSM 5522 TaxID=1120918 RepID=A0A1I0Y1F2_9FIRM|nr:helix-turn-helix domain-containing protein [Acetitomaculum ruminis]SFB06440.1 AraC-type DNA-binding protein [Acetitomaculum ruminis DSM 5522]
MSKKIAKMEEILDYILNHLETKLSIEDIAKEFGYNHVYLAQSFKEYFEMPFHRFVTKLQLRRAAQIVYDTKKTSEVIGNSLYVYSEGFSNAFKKEFGVSCNAFKKMNIQVPDMPMRKKIDGIPVHMEYKIIEPFKIAGYAFRHKQGDQVDMMENVAFPLKYKRMMEKIDTSRELIGVWWNDKGGHVIYVLGHVLKDGELPEKDQIVINVPEEKCAIFTVKKQADTSKTVKAQANLTRFIFREWLKMNEKVTDKMGITFEFFNDENMGVVLPLVKGMNGYESIEKTGNGSNQWIDYINSHIKDNITVVELAKYFGYSEKMLGDIFKLRYEMSLEEYIRKQRLYMVAHEISQKKEDAESAATKYNYADFDDYKRCYKEEYGTDYDENEAVKFKVVNLSEYYKENKKKLKLEYMRIHNFKIGYHKIENECDPHIDKKNIPKMVSDCFSKSEDLEEFYEDNYYVAGKVAMWMNVNRNSQEGDAYEYVIGTPVPLKLPVNQGDEEAYIQGGRYAVFSTMDDSDLDEIEEKYLMMERVVFFGWIRENRLKYDGSRITFVSFCHNKLYFFVPISKYRG